jgi:hypothetical protein
VTDGGGGFEASMLYHIECVGNKSGAGPARGLSSSSRAGCPRASRLATKAVLTRPDFDNAVRDALRHYTRMELPAGNRCCAPGSCSTVGRCGSRAMLALGLSLC